MLRPYPTDLIDVLRPPATAPASAPVIATAAAATTPTDVAAPAPAPTPVLAAATATTPAAGRGRPRLLGRPIGMIGVVWPRPHVGAIRMIGVVRSSPDVGPVGLIGAIGPLAHGERRRAHRNGARVRARDERQGIAGPRCDAAHVHIGPEPIFEIQPGPDACPQAIHEQVVGLVVERRATRGVDERPVPEGPVAETEPAEEERIVERTVVRAAIERVVEERIVA